MLKKMLDDATKEAEAQTDSKDKKKKKKQKDELSFLPGSKRYKDRARKRQKRKKKEGDRRAQKKIERNNKE